MADSERLYNSDIKINQNITFINTLIINTQITIINYNLVIRNCRFSKSNLTIEILKQTNMEGNAYMRDSSFMDSLFFINGFVTCTFESSSFKTNYLFDINTPSERYMLNIKEVSNVYLMNTHFESRSSGGTEGMLTHGGLKTANVSSIQIQDSEFKYLKTFKGSASFIESSLEVNFENCLFAFNRGKDGIIYAKQTNLIKSANSSYKFNYVTNNGGVYYLEAQTIMENVDSVYENNTSDFFGAAIYAEVGSTISNTRTVFRRNRVNEDKGGVVAVREYSTITNDEVKLLGLVRSSAHALAYVFYKR